jgi:hypothetical protein
MARTGPPELDVDRVRRWCAEQVPEHQQDRIRVECEVAGRQLTIFECHPPWSESTHRDWSRIPVARLRYTKTTGLWSLYWCDSNSRFHEYRWFFEAARVEQLLAEIDRDPTNLFWG